MFRINMLPAGRGDCLWIEYGESAAPRRVLIDGGVGCKGGTLRERVGRLERDKRRFELLVITHVDLDHISGALELLREPPDGLSIGEVWFNGWKHLPSEDDVLGPKQGESVSYRIELAGLAWNAAFGGGAVATSGWPEDPPPSHPLEGGLTLTVLGPTRDRLRRLAPVWQNVIETEGLVPGRAGAALEGVPEPDDDEADAVLGRAEPDVVTLADGKFRPDTSEANGSSIALLAAYGGKRCLLAGDAFSDDLAAAAFGLAMAEGEAALAVDALKLSHHGGCKNTSVGLLDRLACPRYLVSTDGSYYRHPSEEAIARVIVHGRVAGSPALFFNYRVSHNEVWDRASLRSRHGYTATYPEAGRQGLSVDL